MNHITKCLPKLRFPTPSRAWKEADRQAKKGRTLYPYQCKLCFWFHLSKSQSDVKRPEAPKPTKDVHGNLIPQHANGFRIDYTRDGCAFIKASELTAGLIFHGWQMLKDGEEIVYRKRLKTIRKEFKTN